MNHSNIENMTPSRLNRVYPPKPQDSVNQNGGDGEGIQVAIRMRPLNSKEHTHKKVWKVLSKYASVAQTTIEGKPLPERIAGRNFFTYDQAFDESSTTYQVYSAIAQPIVTTACTGRNGTIFAYGQTSSGKTYTMQGSGTIAEGSSDNIQNGNGGIVHMAAHDIFAHIASCQDRVFVVRASFLEIYNEEVRDLLQDYSNNNKVLQIREDPRRGVFVQSKEMIATDSTSLLAVLWQGEKSRSFATTAMNERSSRSHTIFRITIESRSSVEDNDDNDSDDTGRAIRVSTLNLVDLAGSESVRHTGATGDRQKEGGMINQSLLTLSRVIVALGTPNSSHINFRDSKLTRILQPSLSGNARMAVVCCATPSELYLEETRSTLLFAGRAKLVKTNAQINEVMDDRSIIRRLQRELALAKSQQNQGGTQIATDFLEWEKNAASAGNDAKLAKDKLKRLYTAILMNNNLGEKNVSMIFGVGERGKMDTLIPVQNNVETEEEIKQPPTKRHRRRMSDGNLQQFLTSNFVSTPSQNRKLLHPFTDPPIVTKNAARLLTVNTLSTSDEIVMMRQAVAAKEYKAIRVKRQMDTVLKQLQGKDLDLVAANCSNDLLRSDRDAKTALCSEMETEIEELKSELAATKSAHEALQVKKDAEIEQLHSKIGDQLEDRRVLEETVDSLQESKVVVERNLTAALIEKDATISSLRNELESYQEQLIHQVDVVNHELRQQLKKSDDEKETLSSSLESTTRTLCVVAGEKDELISNNDKLQEAIKNITGQYEMATVDLNTANESLLDANNIIEQHNLTISSLESIQRELEKNTKGLNDRTIELLSENATLHEDVLRLTNEQEVVKMRLNSLNLDCEAFRQQTSKLEDLLNVSEIKICGLLVVLNKNESEMEGMYSQIKLLSTGKLEDDKLLLHQTSTIIDLESQLSVAIADRDVANDRSGHTRELLNAAIVRCDDLHQNLQILKEERSMEEKANVELIHLNGNMEKRLAEMNQESSNRLAYSQHALENAVRTESILKRKIADIGTEVHNRIDTLLILLQRSEMDKKNLSEESASLKEVNTLLSATVDSLNERIVVDEKAFKERLCGVILKQDEIVAETATRIEGLTVALEHSQMELERSLMDRNLIKTELNSANVSLQHSCEEIVQLTTEIENYKSNTSNNLDTIHRISSERDAALTDATELRTRQDLVRSNDQTRERDVTLLHQKVDALETKCRDCEFSLDSSKQLAEQMLHLFSAIANENRKYLLPYLGTDDVKERVAESCSCSLITMLQMATSKLSHMSNAISMLGQKVYNQSESLISFEKNVLQLEQTIQSNEVSYTKNIERLTSDLKQAEITIDTLQNSVEIITAEKEQFETKCSNIESLGLDVDVVRGENKELKQLLANATHIIDDARMSNNEITMQLNEKTMSLDQVLNQLDAKESELRHLTERLNLDQNCAEMEKLRNEKEGLERLLEEEMANRVHFESALKQRMSAEQRTLIQEAEQEMRRLRGELDFKTDALKRSEAQAYAAREIKDDLEDQCRRTLDRAIQLESQIAAVENEANRLRRLSSRQETEYEAEITTLKERLSFATKEKQESQLLIGDLEKTVYSLRLKLDEASRDLSATRERLNTASSQKLEQRTHLLENELQRTNKELELLQITAAEHVTLNDKLKDLEHDNDKLRLKLKSYVDRCEKLESSKLTKDKLEAIKKLMSDKAAVEKELKVTKQEIELLKCVSMKQSSSTMEGTELTTLRFDKEALESKLRKFASQCQHLEDEKLRIIHTFKSAKIELADENIEKAIVALCDKVASLEEECNSLAKFKNKAFASQVDLTTMQQHNTELSTKIADLQRKIDNLQWVESGHKNLISTLTEGNSKLQRDVDRARQDAESKRNQLKYLEQENLQLMIDYKSAKQKIHGLKAELNHLHSQMAIASAASTRDINRCSVKKPPKTPNDKENLKGSLNRDSDKKKIPSSAVISKEGRTSKEDGHKPITARLGDAFAASDENTQECKQS